MKLKSFSLLMASLLTQGLIASVHDPVQAYNPYHSHKTTNKTALTNTYEICSEYDPPDWGTPARQGLGGSR